MAHGLRTPLTVLRAIAPRLRDRGDEEGASLLERMVDSMDDRIAYQLRLARLRHRTRSHELRSSLNEVLEGTIDVLVRTPAGEALRWETDLLPGLMVNMDRQDLRELVGILLENATKWAATSVTITAQREISNKITLRILDDGPGVPPGYEALLGKRGQRLDETTEGSGLGLAIANEILAINNGSVDFALGPQGGLLVQLHLPAAHG
jgi:signal transduction histidine kinase